ncbi:MAG TPA: hypothetical protein VKT18_00025, partial [Acidimicrobiales bacterium]|nr:hypothetical protein [Acidimicrobiales bacterium]
SSLFAWFFEWPLVAISHGHNPFYSSQMFHPMGINLLSNTSVTAWSFLLLPVTALFGPVASLNVALICAPALSGVATMWVALRWVRSPVVAFLAGALYAFSPLVLFQEAGAHLMVTSLAVPPLVLACLDELFWRRRHSPRTVGVVLGVLVVVQFFTGTEVLTMLAVATAGGLAVLGAFALVRDRDAAVAAVRHGLPGLAVALGVAVVVLAWPAYYALDGPGHYVGLVWPGIAPAQASIRSFLVAVPGTAQWWLPHHSYRFVRPTYLGPALVATMLVGLVVLRRSARLRAAVALTAVVALLALGERYSFAPWHYLDHLPILRDVMNERFSALLLLPAGLALAVVLDALAQSRRRALGVGAAVAVGVACCLPFALDAADGLPYHASRVWEPTWYAARADALPAGSVVLGFPFFNTSADLLAVQALHSMHYAIVGGTGPEWIDARQGAEAPGYEVLKDVASAKLDPTLGVAATPTQRAEVLDALKGWGVTLVVLPTSPAPDTEGVGRSPAATEAWLRSVLGTPRVQDGAWVWSRSP